MSRRWLHCLLFALLCAAAYIASAPARCMAQDAAAVDAANDAADEVIELDENADAEPDADSAAETEEIDLGSADVLGTRSLIDRLDDTRALTVIPAEQLGAGTTIAQVLERVPGVDAREDGGLGQLSTAQVRGARAHQVLVLLDGVPLAPGAAADLSVVPVGVVERVEVVRGPEAARFGMGALGGVVNLVTRRGLAPATTAAAQPDTTHLRELELLAGSFDTYSASLQVQNATDSYSFSHQQAENDYSFSRADGSRVVRENNASRLDAVSADFRHDGIEHLLSVSRMQRGVPGSAEFPTLAAQLGETRLAWRAAGPGGQLAVQVARNVYDDPEPYLQHAALHSASTRLHAEYAWAEIAAAPGWRLKPRLDYIDSTDYGAHYRWGLDAARAIGWNVLGGRFETELGLCASSDAGIDPALRLAWSKPLGKASRFYASSAYAVRHPDFDELYLRSAGSVQGNPDLQSEAALNYELGFTATGKRAVFDAALFATDYRESIIFAPVSAYAVRAQNTGRARVAGAELLADWQFAPKCWWRTAYTWLPVAQYASGTPLTGRAKHHLNSRLEWGSQDWRFALDADYTSPLPADLFGSLRLPARTLCGVELSHPYGGGTLSLGINNVFDTAARDSWNYPLPGRQFTLTWRVSL